MHEDQGMLGGDVGVDIHRLGREEAIDQLVDLDARQSGTPGQRTIVGSTWAPLECVWATAVVPAAMHENYMPKENPSCHQLQSKPQALSVHTGLDWDLTSLLSLRHPSCPHRHSFLEHLLMLAMLAELLPLSAQHLFAHRPLL